MRYVVFTLVAALSLGVLSGATCGQITPPPIVIEPDDTADCGKACAHLKKLGCAEGMPLIDGTSCEEFCIQTQKAGHALAPSCVMTIETCEELEPKCAKPRYYQD